MQKQLRVIIAGASGYTGSELVRLLADHPAADICAFVSSTSAGENVADKIPHWRGRRQMAFQSIDNIAAIDADVVFFATPHGVAMQQAPALLDAGRVVIDLGADFRLKDPATFEQWYGAHSTPQLLPQAVYGLSEANREQLKTANLIACPGCYATAIEIALLPFIAGGHIDSDIIADAKSGTSGAGRRSDRPELLLAEMANNYKAYATDGHRHHPEIVQTLKDGSDRNNSGKPVPPLYFLPHLLPIARGLFANLHFTIDNGATPADATRILTDHWQNNPFIEVLPAPHTAELAQTIGTNRIILSAHPLPANGSADGKADSNRVMICSALDNLQKGAAGQAVQNMNIRFAHLDISETAGLSGALSGALNH